uniref:Glutathione S-transferase n=1 Tax=Ananas comosus var. bracteatus TaxID=296719 RepID=A0A6V7NJS9_ANACO|nr:unnamed protein product [Ananas comosus var. bracteatus]
MRVQIALNLKNVAYEFVDEAAGAQGELLVRSNPVYKLIPVLIHNYRPICESIMIVEYINEVWVTGTESSSILPFDPYDRASARFWASYIDDKLPPVLRIIVGHNQETKKQ